MIRCPVNGIRVAGRKTQGVTLFRVSEKETVVSVARVEDSEDSVEGDEDVSE